MSLALNYTMNLLARREYSEYELRCKMQERAFSEPEIEETIAYLQQKNWQSDARYCENYLYHRSKQGYGLNRIKQELIQLKGIGEDTFYEILNQQDIDWQALALIQLKKKFPHFAQEKEVKAKQKIWRYMLSHGFQPEDFVHFIGTDDIEFL